MDDPSPTRPRRRRRAWVIAALVVAVTVTAGAFALRTPSPVGHWNSKDKHEKFVADYQRASCSVTHLGRERGFNFHTTASGLGLVRCVSALLRSVTVIGWAQNEVRVSS